MKRKLIIFGCGQHARLLGYLFAEYTDLEVAGYIDVLHAYPDPREREEASERFGVPLLAGTEAWQYAPSFWHGYMGIAAVGDNAVRKSVFLEIKKRMPVASFVHPTAYVEKGVSIGEGTVVLAQCYLNTRTVIGANCIINNGVIVEHDNRIGDHVHLSPGVKLAGNVSVGSETHVGIGAVVINSVSIGSGVVVGAGAVVIESIDDFSLAVGVPAKVVRKLGGST